jgi:hypothetical protein
MKATGGVPNSPATSISAIIAARLRWPNTYRNASAIAPSPSVAAPGRGREPGSKASVPSTAMKLTALTPNTQVGPAAASKNPAIAGPTKRATCNERLLMATALSRSRRGTVAASIA